MKTLPPKHVAGAPHDHVVEFYQSDEDLARSLGRHITEGLKSGEAVIVFATDAHVGLFELEAARAGIDLDRARSEGSWVMARAAETISQFLVQGRVDQKKFDAVGGGPIRQMAHTGHPVRAYGEMVAVLWGAGQVAAAMAVEEAWNRLGEILNFSIFCACPKRSLAEPGSGGYLGGVFRAHSAVVGGCPVWLVPAGFEATKLFESELAAPREARRFVVGTLRCWGRPELADSAALVVSELATNAVLHAGSRFAVTVAAVPPAVRISVRDESPKPPQPRQPMGTDRSGRGLALVAGFASSWGTFEAADGKVIWADLAGAPNPGRP